MANYTIIGGDKKEYGPVSAAEVRQWITEGRLNGDTLIRSDNDTEWRPLSTFLEFAPVLQPRLQTPPPLNALPRPALVQESAVADVRTPAICLIVNTGVNVLWALYGTAKALFFPDNLQQLLAQMPAVDDPQAQKMVSTLLSWMTGAPAVASNVLP